MNEPGTKPVTTQIERRKANRFPVVVPIEAQWQEPGGKIIKANTQALEVNASGGLLELKICPNAGAECELTNLVSGERVRARVVGSRRSKKGNVPGVAIELLSPSESFWGVNFQLRKTSAELVKIEQAIKSGGVDPRILIEFRDAVDYVRKTAWAVQEWQERQLQKHDPQTVLPLLTSERIRRTTQLSKAIMKDLAAHEVTRQTAGIHDLFESLDSLYHCVLTLFRERET